jgi:hypothetical protein
MLFYSSQLSRSITIGIKPCSIQIHQNDLALLVHFDFAARGLDVLPFSWSFDDLDVPVHQNMLKRAKDEHVLSC